MTQEEVRKGVRSLLDVKNATFVIWRNTLKMTFSSFFINLDSLFAVFLIVASPWSPMWGRDMNTGHEYRSTDRYNSSCSPKYSPTDMHIFDLSFILFYLNISDGTGYRGGTGSTKYRSFFNFLEDSNIFMSSTKLEFVHRGRPCSTKVNIAKHSQQLDQDDIARPQ